MVKIRVMVLTRASSRGGHIVDEVLQGLVFVQVQLFQTGFFQVQSLAAAPGRPLVVVVVEQTQPRHQQDTQQEQRPGYHRYQLHRTPTTLCHGSWRGERRWSGLGGQGYVLCQSSLVRTLINWRLDTDLTE